MSDDLRCARCGRRIGIYLTEMGRYVAHVIPLALHRAVLARPEPSDSAPV